MLILFKGGKIGVRKQRDTELSIFQLCNKTKIDSAVDISCVELAIAMYDILYPRRSTEQIGIDLGIPIGYNKAL